MSLETNRFLYTLLTATLLSTSVSLARAQFSLGNVAKGILTQDDGSSPCNPQHGADNSHFNSGCCGSPGNRECSSVLNFGKGPWGDSPGCTDPRSNVLRWNSYDGSLLCNLSDAGAEASYLTIEPPIKLPVRDFQFFVTSDLHFYRITYNIDDQVHQPERLNAMNKASTAAGHPFSAVIIPGDISTGPDAVRLGAYRSLWESGTLGDSSINLPVFFGLGNHDISAQGGGYGTNSTDGQRIWEYLDTRMASQNIDTSITGCLSNIDPGCTGQGSSAGSHNYSWDWQGVHMMMLNTWAGDRDRAYTPPLGMDGLAWLKRDLEYYVGNSSRPVILFQHYTLANAGDQSWSVQNRSDFLAAIQKYNVVGLFDGHTHVLSSTSSPNAVNQRANILSNNSGTSLDEFTDGSGGDCSLIDTEYLCSGAVSNFLTVRVSDKYLDVSAYSGIGSSPMYLDPTIGFRGKPGKENSGYCRKRMATNYVDVSSLVSVNVQQSSKTISVTNTSGTSINGALAVQVSNDYAFQHDNSLLDEWDFTDTCTAGTGNPYLVLSEGALAAKSTLTISYSGGSLDPSYIKIFQLGDTLTSSIDNPVVGSSPATIQVSSLSGNAVPFTYRVDAYSTGDRTEWLNVSTTDSATPATFSLYATKLPAYPHVTASFTIIPSDTSIAPLTVPVTLQPALFSVSSNVPYSQFQFDGNATSIPYSNVVTPDSEHKIDVLSPQYPLTGVRYNFHSWSNGGPKLQSFAVPFGGVKVQADFDVSYRLQEVKSPPQGGNVAFTPTGNSGWYPAGDTHVKATPNLGFYFTGYTGGLTSLTTDTVFNLRSPLTITANFASNPTVTISTNVAAAQGSTAMVNGDVSGSPVSGSFIPGTPLTISVPATFLATGDPGTRYVFQQWSDGVTTVQRSITIGTADLRFSAKYTTQIYVSTSANPAGSGSVTGSGWYTPSTSVSLSALPAAGFQFQGFTGGLKSDANPFVFSPVSPETLVANFVSTGATQLYAAAPGPATDLVSLSLPPVVGRVVPFLLRNVGPGGAVGAQIDSITGIQVLSGSGAVTALFPNPALVGNLAAGNSATANVNFAWPVSVTRVRMTVNFSANEGAYRASTILNLFR